MENEASELEEVGPISGRTRRKTMMSSVAASRDTDRYSSRSRVADRSATLLFSVKIETVCPLKWITGKANVKTGKYTD